MLQYIIALLSILSFIVLILRKPKIETYLVYAFFILPFVDTKILPLAYGFVKTFDVITVLSLIIFFKQFISFKRSNEYWGLLVLVMLLWIITIVSNANSEFGFTNLYLLYQIFTVFIFTRFLIIYCSNNWDNRFKIFSSFQTGFTISLVFMALQILFGLGVTYYTGFNSNVFNEETGLIRYPGIFSESQYNGQFLAMGSFMFLTLNKDGDLKYTYLKLFTVALSILFVFLAGSRSAIGGLLFGMFVLFIFSSAQIKTAGLILALLIGSIYVISSPAQGVFSRTENIGEDLDFRQEIWKETYGIIKEHPTLGIGMGNFEPYLEKYHQNMYLEVSPGEIIYFTQPENGYLKILVEHGIIVFTIFLIFITVPLVLTIKNLWLGIIDKNTLYIVAALVSWIVAFNTVYSFLDYRLLVMVATWVTLLIMHLRTMNNDVKHKRNLSLHKLVKEQLNTSI